MNISKKQISLTVYIAALVSVPFTVLAAFVLVLYGAGPSAGNIASLAAVLLWFYIRVHVVIAVASVIFYRHAFLRHVFYVSVGITLVLAVCAGPLGRRMEYHSCAYLVKHCVDVDYGYKCPPEYTGDQWTLIEKRCNTR